MGTRDLRSIRFGELLGSQKLMNVGFRGTQNISFVPKSLCHLTQPTRSFDRTCVAAYRHVV